MVSSKKVAPNAGEAAKAHDGDQCEVVAGAHIGKSGRVEDRRVSKTGHMAITVRLANDDRIKPLARNVVVTRKGGR